MTDNVPLLGSKISLISRADVRYEGILYTIDPNEATVALSKVRSIGTEDRQTEYPIAARDEVFEYIIFRGSDIKDLHVCEAPMPSHVPQSTPNHDPAIVKFSHSGNHYPSIFPSYLPTYRGKTAMYPRTMGGPLKRDQSVQTYQHDNMHQEMGWQVNRWKQAPPNQHYQAGNGYSGGRDFNNTGYNNNISASNSGGSRSYSNRGRKRVLNHCELDFSSKFEGEYDFEYFNAQFDKDQLEKEIDLKQKQASAEKKGRVKEVEAKDEEENSAEKNKKENREDEEAGEQESQQEEVCYDKSKSFFDHISTANHNKANRRRFTWKDEKRLNMETFGLKMVENQQVIRRFNNRPSRGYNYFPFHYNPFPNNYNYNVFSNNYNSYPNNNYNHHFNNYNSYKNHPNNYKYFSNNYNNRSHDASRQSVYTGNLRVPATTFVPRSQLKKDKEVKVVEKEKKENKEEKVVVETSSTLLSANQATNNPAIVTPISEDPVSKEAVGVVITEKM